MHISVIIATHNRAASLRRTLESFACASNLSEPGWEMIVVDNNSTDETAAVCREFVERYPVIFRVLVQTKQGKSNAVNMGMSKAGGDLLAMTDDDVVCAPGYIRGIRNTFFEHPEAHAAQGRILLDCEGGRPEYLHHDLAMFMSLRDYGDECFCWDGNLSGTNMVVRREVILRVGGFTPELGAGAIGFAEDSELSLRMRAAGCRFIYAPNIVVRHQIPRMRLTRHFFRGRYFRSGRSYAVYTPLTVPLWRFSLYTAKELLAGELRAAKLRASGDPAAALRQQCQTREILGLLWQHIRFRCGAPRPAISDSVLRFLQAQNAGRKQC